MQVTVDYDELLKLKNDLKELKGFYQTAINSLAELNEHTLKRKAEEYGVAIANKCVAKVFEGLGFDMSNDYVIRHLYNLDSDDFWEVEDVEFYLSPEFYRGMASVCIKWCIVPPAARHQVAENSKELWEQFFPKEA